MNWQYFYKKKESQYIVDLDQRLKFPGLDIENSLQRYK